MIKFWNKVMVGGPDDCWPWIGARDGGGYGMLRMNKKYYKANRFSYMNFVGTIPMHHDICHSCDNPPCVNPRHLFAGTKKQNMQDCIAKGRFSKPPQKKSKFTDADAAEIAGVYFSCGSLNEAAALYGVSRATVWRLSKRAALR